MVGVHQARRIEGGVVEEQYVGEHPFIVDVAREGLGVDVDDQVAEVGPILVIDPPQDRRDDLLPVLGDPVAADRDDRGGGAEVGMLDDDRVHVPVVSVVAQVVDVGEGVGGEPHLAAVADDVGACQVGVPLHDGEEQLVEVAALLSVGIDVVTFDDGDDLGIGGEQVRLMAVRFEDLAHLRRIAGDEVHRLVGHIPLLSLPAEGHVVGAEDPQGDDEDDEEVDEEAGEE